MSSLKGVVAIAGAGDSARYLVEEAARVGLPIVIISRAPREWFSDRGVPVHICDYSHASLLEILDKTEATALVSLLHTNDPNVMVPAQSAMLSACRASKSCKRFIPSEMGGDIHPDAFPNHPLFYVPTHIPIRRALAEQSEIEWTLLCIGWFGDYWHLPPSKDAKWKSHMKDLRPVWPVDVIKKTIRIAGDGHARVSFTAARDVAAAMIKLLESPNWEPYTYVAGETATWLELSQRLREFYGEEFAVSYRPLEDIKSTIFKEEGTIKQDPKHNTSLLYAAYMDLWNANGAAGLPADRVEDHRKKYFAGVHFKSIAEIIARGKAVQGSTEVI